MNFYYPQPRCIDCGKFVSWKKTNVYQFTSVDIHGCPDEHEEHTCPDCFEKEKAA